MAQTPEVRLALIVMRAVEDVKNDPDKLRTAIYSLARLKVAQEMRDRDPSEAARILEALEVAIGEVEQFSTDQPLLLSSLTASTKQPSPLAPVAGQDKPSSESRPLPAAAPPTGAAPPHRSAPDRPVSPAQPAAKTAAAEAPADELATALESVEVTPAGQPVTPVSAAAARALLSPAVVLRPTPLPPLTPNFNEPHYWDYPPRTARRRKTLTILTPIIAAFCGCVIFAGGLIWQTSQWSPAALIAERVAGKPESTNPAPIVVMQAAPPPQPVPPPAPIYPFPLPKSYGIFAIADDKLVKLSALPGRAADSRIAISAEITRPVSVTLTTGNISFIVYRRDAATAGSDSVDVRAIANIRDHISFDSGRALIERPSDIWAMRNIAYRFSVSPVEGQPDMFILRPQEEGFKFPAGRYGLVLNHQAYDFQIAGQVVDPVHCLEKVAAVNGSFYSPCPTAGTDTPEKKTPPAAQSPRKSEVAPAKKPAAPK